MNYSVCYLDKEGRTRHSEFSAFDSDDAARSFAKSESPKNAIVEVWKDGDLVTRLYQDGR